MLTVNNNYYKLNFALFLVKIRFIKHVIKNNVCSDMLSLSIIGGEL
ncbi:MAG: hypothetical protein BWY04_00010 [candidate division CPR1 bacterium ADurb.Bin160]|uniref:Uncharacterized protein n=1 Tax=candidate division CPR1 bacterium ADurb.Bin160 TaxID=1852826 RepID=A0A1V5ZRY3_9BACT|nr:MAG: hypothetical protein BWY04_00010 [candidate division CPR1 bacterium ADurb.Bin160]